MEVWADSGDETAGGSYHPEAQELPRAKEPPVNYASILVPDPSYAAPVNCGPELTQMLRLPQTLPRTHQTCRPDHVCGVWDSLQEHRLFPRLSGVGDQAVQPR